MDAKRYLEEIRQMYSALQTKEELRKYYMKMACRPMSRHEATRLSGTEERSGIEEYAIKLIQLEKSLERQKNELRQRKNDARCMLQKLGDQRLYQVMDLRYCRNRSWEEIASMMRYDRSSVWRFHSQALRELQEQLPFIA